MRFSWGTSKSSGHNDSHGGESTVDLTGTTGQYLIDFDFKATTIPAIVGSQTNSGNVGEANTDGIVFPRLDQQGATAITGDNTGAQQNRSFSFIAASDAVITTPRVQQVLWGAVTENGEVVSGSGGFSVTKPPKTTGQYEITFELAFTSMPAIVATQTNSGNISEANTDGIVVPLLTEASATLITGNNKSTPDNRSFSFIAVGQGGPGSPQTQDLILWGSINEDGTIAGGSGGFWVGHQPFGIYVITFPAFANPPVIVGSQAGSNNLSQDNREGMVFPWVNNNYAIAITGDAAGNQQDRSFSFIAIGPPVTANPK